MKSVKTTIERGHSAKKGGQAFSAEMQRELNIYKTRLED